MTNNPADWSPADNPYAIAVSEAQWWMHTAQLAVLRLRDSDDRRIPFSSRQIDARHLVVALQQLCVAERLEQDALQALGIDQAVSDALSAARQQFESTLPGLKDMRDALTHFDEWSRGEGRGPQRARRDAGAPRRDVAKEFWGFEFDPMAETVNLGPYSIHIEKATEAAVTLAKAIYHASRAVDARNTAELRARTVEALTTAAIAHNTATARLQVSPGLDNRIWFSFKIDTPFVSESDYRDEADRIVVALGGAGLQLVSPTYPDALDASERLARREALFVRQTLPAP
jgi:hypothetical protein